MNDLPAKTSTRELAGPYEDAETVYSVLQGVSRGGPWEPPEAMRVVSVMGSIVLDYRQAELPLGVTTLDCAVYMGSVEIILPSDVDLELTGSVFLGSVETKSGEEGFSWRRVKERLVGGRREPELEHEEEYERPLLSVDCSGLMGSVELKLA